MITPAYHAGERSRVEKLSRSPEFIDAKGVREIFGISRSHAYRLSQEGLIKSVSLRPPGAIKGKRLWVVDSVRQYITSCADVPKNKEDVC
jgi:predicted DNA-binding transcriptional regulator AlpA